MSPFGAIAVMLATFTAQNGGTIELGKRLRQIEIDRSRGDLAGAESLLAEAETAIAQNAPLKRWQAAILRERGLLRDDEGFAAEAIPLYEQAVALLRAEPSPNANAIGVTLANLAGAKVDCGDAAVGLSLAAEAMTAIGETAHPDFAFALYAHGLALHALGQNLDALHDLRAALAIWNAASEPDYGQIALLNDTIALCYYNLGYANKAEAAERESLAIRGRFFGDHSIGTGASLNNLGVFLARTERYSEAEESLNMAAAIFDPLGKTATQRLLTVLENLGQLYLMVAARSGAYYAKAETVYRHKLAIEQQIFGDSDVRVSSSLEALGEVLYHQRTYNEAATVYHRGLTLQETILGESDPRTQAAEKRYRLIARKIKAPVH
jgi:tetratricopeptide (TPR) repeat protein